MSEAEPAVLRHAGIPLGPSSRAGAAVPPPPGLGGFRPPRPPVRPLPGRRLEQWLEQPVLLDREPDSEPRDAAPAAGDGSPVGGARCDPPAAAAREPLSAREVAAPAPVPMPAAHWASSAERHPPRGRADGATVDTTASAAPGARGPMREAGGETVVTVVNIPLPSPASPAAPVTTRRPVVAPQPAAPAGPERAPAPWSPGPIPGPAPDHAGRAPTPARAGNRLPLAPEPPWPPPLTVPARPVARVPDRPAPARGAVTVAESRSAGPALSEPGVLAALRGERGGGPPGGGPTVHIDTIEVVVAAPATNPAPGGARVPAAPPPGLAPGVRAPSDPAAAPSAATPVRGAAVIDPWAAAFGLAD